LRRWDLGRSTIRLTAPLALSIALVGLATGAGLLFLGPPPPIALYGVTVAAVGLVVWHFTENARPVALTLLALATVVPEYLVEVHFAWEAASPSTTGHPPPTLAAVSGASGLLVGLAWPLVIILCWVRSGGSALRLEWGQRPALWFLLLAALYAFTIYLKGFLAVLDTLLLALLLGACVWTVWRRQKRARELDGAARVTGAEGRHQNVPTGALVCLAAGMAMATAPFAEALAVGARSMEGDPFGLVQWLVPMVSKTPLLVILAVLVWKGRAGYATSMLITSQAVQLTVLLGSLPVAYFLNGFILGDGATFALDDRQRSELLLTSAQTLFLIVVLARMKVSIKGALALMALFTLQAALSALAPGTQSTLAQTIPAAVYLSAATALIYRDRSRLQLLLEMIPSRRGGAWREPTSNRMLKKPY
jgi:cation:H+ antiporter